MMIGGILTKKPKTPKTTRTKRFHRKSDEHRATVVVFSIFKGGTGKTTLCREVAGALARDHDVLLVDMDAQGNLTAGCRIDRAPYSANVKGLGDVLMSENPDAAIKESVYYVEFKRGAKLSFIPNAMPGGKPLLEADMVAGNLMYAGSVFHVNSDSQDRFRIAIDSIRPFYDYILVDTGPSALGSLNKMAFRAADQIVATIDGFQALSTIPTFVNAIREEGRPDINFLSYNWLKDPSFKDGKPDDPQNRYYSLCSKYLAGHFLKSNVQHRLKYERKYQEMMNSRDFGLEISLELLDKWNDNKATPFFDDWDNGLINHHELIQEARSQEPKIKYRRAKFFETVKHRYITLKEEAPDGTE